MAKQPGDDWHSRLSSYVPPTRAPPIDQLRSGAGGSARRNSGPSSSYSSPAHHSSSRGGGGGGGSSAYSSPARTPYRGGGGGGGGGDHRDRDRGGDRDRDRRGGGLLPPPTPPQFGGGGGGGGGGGNASGAVSVSQNGHHKLYSPWVMFFKAQGLPSQGRGGGDGLRRICVCPTVEIFWSCFAHLNVPTQLNDNSDYLFFRQGIQPTWEDRNNKDGGKWIITVNRVPGQEYLLDQIWAKVLAALVGEALDIDNDVCGAVVSKRHKGDRIAVWNKSFNDNKKVLGLAKRILQSTGLLAVKEHIKFEYQAHQADDDDTHVALSMTEAEDTLSQDFIPGLPQECKSE